MKTCRKCNVEKEFSCFKILLGDRGRQYLKSYCISCDLPSNREIKIESLKQKRANNRKIVAKRRILKRFKRNCYDVCRRRKPAPRRNELIKIVGGSYSKKELFSLYRKQEKKCVYCKACLTEGYHKDHIFPISRGGHNGISNIQLLCPRCNMSKQDKTHEEYIKFLSERNDITMMLVRVDKGDLHEKNTY